MNRIAAGVFLIVKIIAVLILVWLLYEIPFVIKQGGLIDSPFFAHDEGPANTLYPPNSECRQVNTDHDGFQYMVRINNHGFRGKHITLEPPENQLRILVAGDSFTMGVGVEDHETIPAVLEQELLKKGYAVNVINAGRGFANSLRHYMSTRDIHLRFKPDIMLLLFDFSDLKDDWRAERNLITDENGMLQLAGPSTINGKRNWWVFLVLNSRLANYIDRKVVRTYKKMKTLGFGTYISAKLQGKRAKAVIAERKDAMKRNEDPIEYDQYLMLREGKEELIAQHWQRSTKYLALLHELLQSEGIPLILVSYPYGIHVGKNQWDVGRTQWGFSADTDYSGAYAFGLVSSFAQEQGIPYIETVHDLRAYRDELLYYHKNGHFTSQGCQRLGEILAASPVLEKVLAEFEVEEKK